MPAIICFVSDFGWDDAWVGVCHATMHRVCPQAEVVDLGHQVPAFDIRKGAVVASSGVWQLPEAIHLVVVDPGVGGERHDLCLVTGEGTRLVGPDNGVLVPAARRAGGVAEAFRIDPAVVSQEPPLPTFHARDVLAPAAAALAAGVEPSALGTPLEPDGLVEAPFGVARRDGDIIATEVLDIERFGSARLGIAAEELEAFGLTTGRCEVTFGHVTIEAPLGRTFADVAEGKPLLLVDSSGWLTLSVRMGSAADRFGVEAGTTTRLTPIGET